MPVIPQCQCFSAFTNNHRQVSVSGGFKPSEDHRRPLADLRIIVPRRVHERPKHERDGIVAEYIKISVPGEDGIYILVVKRGEGNTMRIVAFY